MNGHNPGRVFSSLLLGVGLAVGCNGAGFPWPLEDPGKVGSAGLGHAEVEQLGAGYDRRLARAMVRRVARPTRANLDYAAYAANVMLHQPDAEVVQPEGQVRVDQAQLFDGFVVADSIVAAIARTPLTEAERRAPLAFTPLVDYLSQWDPAQGGPLEDARAAVRGETWGATKRPGTTFQQIVALYVHRPAGGAVQLWARIEFQPWAKLFAGMPDEDGDGYPQVYGRLKGGLASSAVIARIEEDYIGRVLSAAEVLTWANELASYWYPSHNTDIADLGGAQVWPAPATERAVTASLGGLSIREPTLVIRGKPHGQPIYNVIVVPGMPSLSAKKKASGGAAGATALVAALKQAKVSADPGPLVEALEAERDRQAGKGGAAGQGGYQGWARRLAPLHRAIRRQLKRRPKKLQTLIGRQGFLFYRRSLDSVVGGDVQQQPKGKNPMPAILAFQQHLARHGVDFLLVPVPTKAEVFPDKLRHSRVRADQLEPINPYGRKFLLELARGGVEAVDLLPTYLAARAKRGPEDELLYQPQDTHWTDRGLRIAARTIAERIKRYPWYPALARRAVKYGTRAVSFQRLGDLHSRLAPPEQPRFKPAQLVGHQVLSPDGKPYEDQLGSPIVIIGDSFTGVFQRTYCKHAGVSAHVAREIGYPVDLEMSWGGGPSVRQRLLERGVDALKKVRLVIWLFASRDFHNYWEDWEVLEAAKSPGK